MNTNVSGTAQAGNGATLLVVRGLSLLLLGTLNSAVAQTWTQTSAPATNWQAVACSADGGMIFAAIAGAPIFASTNSGATWVPTDAPAQHWYALACSAEGTTVVAAIGGPAGWYGPVFVSTNSGQTWTAASGASTSYLTSTASSADGRKLWVATVDPIHHYGAIYTSTNQGTSWAADRGPTEAIASSADGQHLVSASLGYLYTSADGGASWILAAAPQANWHALAGSSDGSKWIAAAASVDVPAPSTPGPIFTSTNSGFDWSSNTVTPQIWRAVASSANGSKLIAAAEGDALYVSADSGATWIATGPVAAWRSVASSADGSKLVAVANDGGIWISQSAPAPVLKISSSAGNSVVSWTVPSLDFTLQENSNLVGANWTDVTNTPSFNPATMQYQVIVSRSSSQRFYRLKH